MIKENYPNLVIVQVGTDRCKEIPEIDVNLLGKTNFEELKIILKNSILHIDGECGLVHLKHFLNGKSAVLFGQTSIDYIGYENNINLKSNACPHWCEWIVDDWQNNCIRGYKEPPCLAELKPDYVFENIKPYLDKITQQENKVINELKTLRIQKAVENLNLTNCKIIFFGTEFLNDAKILAKENIVKVYDAKIDKNLFAEAKKDNVLLDFANIYNLPEDDGTCDVAVVNIKNIEDWELAKNEIFRVLGNEKTLIMRNCD